MRVVEGVGREYPPQLTECIEKGKAVIDSFEVSDDTRKCQPEVHPNWNTKVIRFLTGLVEDEKEEMITAALKVEDISEDSKKLVLELCKEENGYPCKAPEASVILDRNAIEPVLKRVDTFYTEDCFNVDIYDQFKKCLEELSPIWTKFVDDVTGVLQSPARVCDTVTEQMERGEVTARAVALKSACEKAREEKDVVNVTIDETRFFNPFLDQDLKADIFKIAMTAVSKTSKFKAIADEMKEELEARFPALKQTWQVVVGHGFSAYTTVQSPFWYWFEMDHGQFKSSSKKKVMFFVFKTNYE